MTKQHWDSSYYVVLHSFHVIDSGRHHSPYSHWSLNIWTIILIDISAAICVDKVAPFFLFFNSCEVTIHAALRNAGWCIIKTNMIWYNINPRGLTNEEKLKLDLDIYLRFPYINLKEIGSWGFHCWLPGSVFGEPVRRSSGQRIKASPTSVWPSLEETSSCQSHDRRIATVILTLFKPVFPATPLASLVWKSFHMSLLRVELSSSTYIEVILSHSL